MELGEEIEPPQRDAEQEPQSLHSTIALQMLAPVSARWSWKQQRSSALAVSGVPIGRSSPGSCVSTAACVPASHPRLCDLPAVRTRVRGGRVLGGLLSSQATASYPSVLRRTGCSVSAPKAVPSHLKIPYAPGGRTRPYHYLLAIRAERRGKHGLLMIAVVPVEEAGSS
jgi:hypothetical protein